MSIEPLVSLVIVHYGSQAYLERCLDSIRRSTYANVECILVDNNGAANGHPPLSVCDLGRGRYTYLRNERNLGFAEGCNQGIRVAEGKYVFILNNDIELHPDCIGALVSLGESNSEIGILQPKMLDFAQRDVFHSSAAGGFIDVLGYPFARGRILEAVERDAGQYDDAIEIFWAGGAALFARRDVVVETGLFDSDFFLYMEEIDLAWRVQLLGYKLVYTPSAVIYHLGCPHLGRENFWRMYYVHRNSMIMLVKNLAFRNLVVFLPARVAFELAIALGCLVSLRVSRSLAILRAFGYLASHLGAILQKRRTVQRSRRVADAVIISRAYCGSVALSHFLRRTERVADLKGFQVRRYASVERRQ